MAEDLSNEKAVDKTKKNAIVQLFFPNRIQS